MLFVYFQSIEDDIVVLSRLTNFLQSLANCGHTVFWD